MWAWGQRSENVIPELSCHPLWWGTGSLCPAIAGTWGTGSETLLPLFGKCVIVAFNKNRTCEASLLEHPYRLSHGHAEWSSFKVTKKGNFHRHRDYFFSYPCPCYMISQDFITNHWSLGGFAQYVWPLMNTIIQCRTIFTQKNTFSSCLLRKNRFWQHKCCISQSTVVFVVLLAIFHSTTSASHLQLNI